MSRCHAKLAPALIALAVTQAFATPPATNALPTGGRVVAGSAAIAQSGARMDVNQGSQRAILDWQRFDIGSGAQVNFAQPNAAAIALNRVLAGDASQIMGKLSANGQVFLVNPAGIVFGAGSRVDVGGLVASSLDIGNDDFLAGRHVFAGQGGAVINRGTLTAADGGYVALLAPEVRNEGVIFARLGSVALGAGSAMTLDFHGDGLLTLAIDQGALNALIDNKQLIQADGGQVLMSARAADELTGGIINHSGTVRARTLENRAGRILLLGDMTHGAVNLTGTLDASAPAGGPGGFVETSAAKVGAGETARVTTLAADGHHGTWLIDPNDYTIAASGGNISGAILAANLAGGNVTISTATQGTAGGNGDIFVNEAVSWNANTTLSLQAQRDININAPITASGNTAGLTLGYGSGRDYSLNNNATINLPGSNPALKIGVAGSEASYIVINSLGVADDATTTSLQGMKNNLSGNYALGSNIDAGATSGWNDGLGFTPIDSNSSSFQGKMAGNNHVIRNLHINRPAADDVGLIGWNSGTIRDIGLIDAQVTGKDWVGVLAGLNSGTISNSYASGTVTGSDNVGGLVGEDWGTISNSYAAGTVSGTNHVGGLVGKVFYDTVHNAHYDIDQTTINGQHLLTIGGLYHAQYQDWLSHGKTLAIADYAASLPLNGGYYGVGSVQGLKDLLGFADNPAYKFRLTADLDLVGAPGLFIPYFAAQQFDGGSHLVANLSISQAMNSHMGFIGILKSGSTVNDLGVVGASVSGRNSVGGLAGDNEGTISNSYATGMVSGNNQGVGGLAGYDYAWDYITTSYWNTQTSGQATSDGGTGLTTAQMMAAANFTSATAANGNVNSNWDFTTVWRIVEGQTYPALRALVRPLTVASNASTTYTGTGWSGAGTTYAYSIPGTGSLVFGTPIFGGTAPGATNVGSYTITSAPTLVSAQFDLSYADGTLTIGQAPLTVTARDAGKTYDGQAYSGGNGVTYSGFVNGETSAVLGGTLAYGGSSQGARNADIYSITPSGLSAGNYSFNYVNGALTINPAPLTVTASNAGKTYDGLAYSGGNGVTYSGFVNGEASAVLGGTLTYGGSSQGARNADIYSITPSGLSAGNYSFNYVDGALTINPAPLSVTASNAGKTYDGLAYSGGNGVTYSGFVNGETSAVLGGTLVYGGSSQGVIPVGRYGITPSGLFSGNYALSYADGVLSIQAREEAASTPTTFPVHESRETALAGLIDRRSDAVTLEIRADFIKAPQAQTEENPARQ